tara:strand:+ start:151 stop:387 length:237 start_codon:yes stop_codon:yes gene_type:complete
VIRIIGSFVNSKKTRPIEILPIKDIDNNSEVKKLEIKISSLEVFVLKLLDSKNKNENVNVIKLIINFRIIMEILYKTF